MTITKMSREQVYENSLMPEDNTLWRAVVDANDYRDDGLPTYDVWRDKDTGRYALYQGDNLACLIERSVNIPYLDPRTDRALIALFKGEALVHGFPSVIPRKDMTGKTIHTDRDDDCPVCGSSDYESIGIEHGFNALRNMCRCNQCGSTFAFLYVVQHAYVVVDGKTPRVYR